MNDIPHLKPDQPALVNHALPLAGLMARAKGDAGIDVTWARHQDEVREAQRLRYQVFAGEMGAVSYTHLTLPTICSV